MRVAAPGMLAVLTGDRLRKRLSCDQTREMGANGIKLVKQMIKEGLYKDGRTPACYFLAPCQPLVFLVRIK